MCKIMHSELGILDQMIQCRRLDRVAVCWFDQIVCALGGVVATFDIKGDFEG